MATYQISFGSGPSTNEEREHPCVAGGVGPGAQLCGATPASLWERYCENGHSRECRLCPSHALLIARGNGACSECLAKGVDGRALLRPVDLILLGHVGT
jgi:hypothetical protein